VSVTTLLPKSRAQAVVHNRKVDTPELASTLSEGV
jgi:hypothetical protein